MTNPSPMTPASNKTTVTNFAEEVINQGRLERVDDLVAVDFIELDLFSG
jgi:hypothetical protein